MPSGFSAGGVEQQKEVEGFGGAGGEEQAPPPEGFGDSVQNAGLDAGGEGYLEQMEEVGNTVEKIEYVDVGPGNWVEDEKADVIPDKEELDPEGPQEDNTANVEQVPDQEDLEPGGNPEAAAPEPEGVGKEYPPPGEADLPADGKEEVVSEEESLARPKFTAQLKAAGYGGFHSWRMELLRGLVQGVMPRTEAALPVETTSE